jgi:hypothetical protein
VIGMMKKTLFKVITLVFVVCLVTSSSGVDIARASLVVSQLEPDQESAIISTIGEGLGIITGITQAGGWLASAFSGNSKVEIKKGLPLADFDVELGFVYQLDYDVHFRFEDTWTPKEWAFFELYVLLNREVVYYQRYPETGYIANPEAWRDDSMSKNIIGSVYLGAEKWPCKNVVDEVKIVAVVWEDTLRWHPEPKSHWIDKDIDGKEVGIAENYGTTIGLDILSEAEQTMKVTVFNPYYVETVVNDNGKEKAHGADFDLQFKAVMNYNRTYPQIPILEPDPRKATVTVDPLESKMGWSFYTEGPLTFEFVPGVSRNAEQSIRFKGHHQNVSHPSRYTDDWGAKVEGKNRIYYEKDKKKIRQSFTWNADFRLGSQVEDQCTPNEYTVSCPRLLFEEQHDGYIPGLEVSWRSSCSWSSAEIATLTIELTGKDLTGGEALVTRVVLEVDGSVIHDSGLISDVSYTRSVTLQVSKGSHSIKVWATNAKDQRAEASKTITCG